jgi:transcriptional regulator with XRE-family HTH domain
MAQNVKTARLRRRWTQRELAEHLAQVGLPVDQGTVAKIESGKRALSVEDAVALAAALNVALFTLILPNDMNGEVALSPGVVATTLAARRWFSGRAPLDGIDEPDYFDGADQFDAYLRRDPHLGALTDTVEREALAALGYAEMSAHERARLLRFADDLMWSANTGRDPDPEGVGDDEEGGADGAH